MTELGVRRNLIYFGAFLAGTYTEFASGANYVCLGGGGGPFWPDILTGLGLAAITYVGRLLSFLSVEIYFYFGPLAGRAS